MLITFSRTRDDAPELELGPFRYAQLTYDGLFVDEGELLAEFTEGTHAMDCMCGYCMNLEPGTRPGVTMEWWVAPKFVRESRDDFYSDVIISAWRSDMERLAELGEEEK